MGRKENQFVAAAGQYLVAYELAKSGFHVSLTVGNAPNVDLLAATADGSRSFSVQVKASVHASRKRNRIKGKYWILGKVPPKGASFWYAFVDLQGLFPDVYFVPSDIVHVYSHRILSMPFFFMSDAIAQQYRGIPSSFFNYPITIPLEIIQSAP